MNYEIEKKLYCNNVEFKINSKAIIMYLLTLLHRAKRLRLMSSSVTFLRNNFPY